MIIPATFLIFDFNKIFFTLNDTDKQQEKNKAVSCLVHFLARKRLTSDYITIYVLICR